MGGVVIMVIRITAERLQTGCFMSSNYKIIEKIPYFIPIA